MWSKLKVAYLGPDSKQFTAVGSPTGNKVKPLSLQDGGFSVEIEGGDRSDVGEVM